MGFLQTDKHQIFIQISVLTKKGCQSPNIVLFIYSYIAIPDKEPGANLIDEQKAEKMADIMKAVAHPLRFRIVAILCNRDERVTEISESLGVKQALVSQQLRILRMAGLVQVSKSEGSSRYTLKEPKLKDLVRCGAECSVRRPT